MLKKRFLRDLIVLSMISVFFSVFSAVVLGQCCVYSGIAGLPVTCDDVFVAPGQEIVVQAQCEDAGGEYFTEQCADIDVCVEECTADQNFTCPDGSEITVATCVAGILYSTGEECEALVDTCANGMKDTGETDVDCGGICAPCEVGKLCEEDDDCESKNCTQNVCKPAEVVPEVPPEVVPEVPPEVEVPTCGNSRCDIGENYQNCIYDCGVCGDGVIHNEECEDDSDCFEGECERCMCTYTCVETPPAPLNFYVTNVRGENALMLAWSLNIDMGCELNSLLAYRCEQKSVSECVPSKLVYMTDEEKISYSYKDTDIKPHTDYCYQVFAYYGEAGTETSSDVFCTGTNEESCMQGQGYFCENNILYSCGAENEKTEVQNCSQIQSPIGSYFCQGPDEKGNVGCVFQNNCDLCNGLFGLFGTTGETEHMLIAPLGGRKPGIVGCDEEMIKSCFFDSTKTTIDKYLACSNISSCYDYRSKGACNENKCALGDCEWSESKEAASELGIGVCRPVNQEKQDCSLCDTDMSESRNLFFGLCSDDVCRLYGDCYYALNSYNQPECSPKESLGCRAYTSRTDCVNADDSGIAEAEVNVTYNANGKREGGTNIITTQSNDYFKFGTCKWGADENGAEICMKDADGNNQPDCSHYDTPCQTDNTPPETRIVPEVPFENGRMLLGKEVNLKLETSEPAVIYFCFAREDKECYPSESTACGIQKKVDYSGPYAMYYYSEDRAHNLEEVKSIPVLFDNTIPSITTKAEIYNKRTAIITLIANSDMTCSGHLEDDLGVLVYSDIVIENERVAAGGSISRSYVNLEDDNYYFVYECRNRAGNKKKGEIYFSIDNNRIHDPSPMGPVPETAVDMRIATDQAAKCRYAPTTGTEQRYDDMLFEFDDSDDGLTHTSRQFVLPNEYYSFDVKCMFEDGIIEGENNDRIRFASDKTPPKIIPVSTFAAYGFDQTQEYGAKQTLMLQCRDDYMLQNYNVRGMDFGCNATTYTYTDPSTQLEVTKSFSGDILSDPFTVESSQLINYTTSDKGGKIDSGGISVQIDTSPPILGLEVFRAPISESSISLDAVAYGDYILKLSSSKSLIASDVDIKVFGEQVYVITPTFLGDEDFGKIHYYSFTIPWDLPEMEDKVIGINATAVEAKPGEFCSVDAALEENKHPVARNFSFDTTMPDADLDPELEKYWKKYHYPLNYNDGDGLFYTNQNPLFITGSAKTGTVRVNFYTGHSMADMDLAEVYELSQNAHSEPISKIKNFQGSKGDVYVYNYLGGLESLGVVSGNYLEFDDPRESYGHYHEYYRIVDVQGSQIELDDALEEDVKLSQEINVFDRPYPNNWFGAEIMLDRGLNYFFIRPESRGGLEGYLKKTYAIVYDPDGPEVIAQTPSPGYTENTETPISITVREPVGSSQLQLDSVKLLLTSKGSTTKIIYKKLNITSSSDGQYVYYQMTYTPSKAFNGTYYVNFTGHDYALNPLAKTASASPEWVFTVNEDSPEKPAFTVIGGVKWPQTGNGVWYIRESPTFTLFFPDPVPIDITAYYKNYEGNYINVPDCKGMADGADGNLFTGCRFDPELAPRVIGAGGGFVENEYQIIVEARKMFEGNAFGPKSPLYLEKLVIDDVSPYIRAVVYPKKIRENYEFEFDATVDNEAHDLNATLLFNEMNYQLTQTGKEGNHYYFKWKTPQLDYSNTAIRAEYEGNHSIILRIADYAGNFDTFEASTYMDLTPPDIEHLEVTVMPTRVISTGEFLTNQTEVRIKGNFTDEDVKAIYVIPGDYIYVPRQRPILENISELANIVGKTFELTMIINGTFNKTILNKLNVYMEDEAGYAAYTPLYVVADLQPPYAVRTSIV